MLLPVSHRFSGTVGYRCMVSQKGLAFSAAFVNIIPEWIEHKVHKMWEECQANRSCRAPQKVKVGSLDAVSVAPECSGTESMYPQPYTQPFYFTVRACRLLLDSALPIILTSSAHQGLASFRPTSIPAADSL